MTIKKNIIYINKNPKNPKKIKNNYSKKIIVKLRKNN